MSRPHPTIDELVDRIGDRRTSFADRSGRRFVVGVCGPPGAGKSTIADRLGRELGAPVVPMDGFHLPNVVLDEHDLRSVKGSPETFDADGFVAAVRMVGADGDDVLLPGFDRVGDEPVSGAIRVSGRATTVVVEGNYLLLDEPPWSELTSLIDLIAYVDLDDDVRVSRLVARHVEFGKPLDEAVAFVRESDERNAARIAACRHRADVIVQGA